jgi:translocator protein
MSAVDSVPLWKPSIIAAGAVILTAGAGGLLSPIGEWYWALKKPWFQPPDWLFGPAWTIIFTLIAIAAVSAWRGAPDDGSRTAIIAAFAFNFVLNVAWSGLFFTLRRPDWALIEVVFLWLSIVLLMWVVWPYSQRATWLLTPYLAWVTFASILNFALVRLNYPFARSSLL